MPRSSSVLGYPEAHALRQRATGQAVAGQVHTEEEIQKILPIATRHGVPVTFRAAGTSLSGQAITDSVLLKLSHTGRNFRNYTIHVRRPLPPPPPPRPSPACAGGCAGASLGASRSWTPACQRRPAVLLVITGWSTVTHVRVSLKSLRLRGVPEGHQG